MRQIIILISMLVSAGLVACEGSVDKDAKVAAAKVIPGSAQNKAGKEKQSSSFSEQEWADIILLRSLLRESQIVFEQVWLKIETAESGKKNSVLGELRSRIDASFSKTGQDMLALEKVVCNPQKHIQIESRKNPITEVASYHFYKNPCSMAQNEERVLLAESYKINDQTIQIRFQAAAFGAAAGRFASFLNYDTQCTLVVKEEKYLGALSCKNLAQDTGVSSHNLLELMQLNLNSEVFVKGQKFENVSDLREKFEFKMAVQGDGVYLYETFEDDVPEMVPSLPVVNEPGLESNPAIDPTSDPTSDQGDQNGQEKADESQIKDHNQEANQEQSEETGEETNEEQNEETSEDQLTAEEELQFTGA